MHTWREVRNFASQKVRLTPESEFWTSDGVSRLVSHFCEPQSRLEGFRSRLRDGLEGYRSRSHPNVLRLWILQRNGLINIYSSTNFCLLYLQVNMSEKCQKF